MFYNFLDSDDQFIMELVDMSQGKKFKVCCSNQQEREDFISNSIMASLSTNKIVPLF